jgi:hypothetical protein
MIALRSNVLPSGTDAQQSFGVGIFGRVRSEDYRNAVSYIVKEVELENDWDDEQLAEALGCSKGTVKNARQKKGNLDPVTMLNLGALFGGQQRLRPVLALANGNPAPKEETTTEKRRRLLRELTQLEEAD